MKPSDHHKTTAKHNFSVCVTRSPPHGRCNDSRANHRLGALGFRQPRFQNPAHHGMKQSLTSAGLAAAAELAEATVSRAEVVSQARQFFTDRTGFVPVGLEELPSCWLQQLPTLLWNGHKPGEDRLPYMVLRLAFEQGVLGIAFLQEPPNENNQSPAGIGCAFCSTCFSCPTCGARSRGKRNWKFGRGGLNCGGSSSRWKTDGGCNHATGYPSAPGWNWSPRRCGSGNKEQGRFRNCGFRRTARQQGHRNSVEKVPAKVPANTVLKGLKRVKKNSGGGMLDSERKCFIISMSAMQ